MKRTGVLFSSTVFILLFSSCFLSTACVSGKTEKQQVTPTPKNDMSSSQMQTPTLTTVATPTEIIASFTTPFESNNQTLLKEEDIKALQETCSTILENDVINCLNLTFPEVEQRLGQVKEIQFNCWGEYRIYFMKSKDYRFEFGNIPLPSECWYTWETEKFYEDYEWRQADNMVFFEGGDDCDSIEVNISSVYPEWKDRPTVFHSSMVETTPDFDPSETGVFYSMVEEREKRGISTFEGMYDAEYEYNGYSFYFSWLNSDGSFTDKTWCMIKHI